MGESPVVGAWRRIEFPIIPEPDSVHPPPNPLNVRSDSSLYLDASPA